VSLSFFQHLGVLGASGQTITLLGLGLLWTYRAEAAEWLREFFEILRGEVSGRDPHLSDPTYRRTLPRKPARGAALMIGGLAMICIGQLLLVVDLTSSFLR
jgi:hypothetical protein